MQRSIRRTGFTLFEVLVSLSLTLFVISTVVAVITMLNQQQSRHLEYEMMWQQFIAVVERELRDTTRVVCIHRTLHLETSDGTVQFQQYGRFIRRQEQFKGHELIVDHIASLSIRCDETRVTLVGRFDDGQEMETTVHL